MCAYIQTQRWLCYERTETSNLHKKVHCEFISKVKNENTEFYSMGLKCLMTWFCFTSPPSHMEVLEYWCKLLVWCRFDRSCTLVRSFTAAGGNSRWWNTVNFCLGLFFILIIIQPAWSPGCSGQYKGGVTNQPSKKKCKGRTFWTFNSSLKHLQLTTLK